MLDHFEDYKNLHNIVINAGFTQLLHYARAAINKLIEAMSQPSKKFIELEIFATNKML